MFNRREQPFFQSTLFLYFTKVVMFIHSSMDTVLFGRVLATMNCLYTMYLTVFLLKANRYLKGAYAVIHLSGTVIILGGHLQ